MKLSKPQTKPPATRVDAPTISHRAFAEQLASAIPVGQSSQQSVEAATSRILDTVAAAKYLGVSRQLLELMRVTGGGPRYAKLGRLVRYRLASLDAWVSEREVDHTAESAAR